MTLTERDAWPLLDIVSYGRKGPAVDRLSAKQIEEIRRTIRRAPEVMIKVTSGAGATSARGIAAHIAYISRRGREEIMTDDGQGVRGADAGAMLVRDWDIDVAEGRSRAEDVLTDRCRRTKLVHRVVFSMPPGTPPGKLLAAVRDFAAQQFAPLHRYAMVLHTDEPHPHVHVVVKAVSERGERLNIRKETLRRWRSEFAHHLRRHGVDATATSRAIRGQGKFRKLDGIYRAASRGQSIHMRQRAEQAMRRPAPNDAAASHRLNATRATIIHAWQKLVRQLLSQGESTLGDQVSRFLAEMPQVQTEAELLREQVRANVTRHRTETRQQSKARIS